MGLAVGYMGTKKHLAPIVSEVVSTCKPGPVLDAFSGMCAVGEAIGTSRAVWHNDVQRFSFEVAKAFFGSTSLPPTASFAVSMLYADYIKNKNELSNRFNTELKEEEAALSAADYNTLYKRATLGPHVGNNVNLEKERLSLIIKPKSFPYRMFSITFSDGYFGLQQSIEIDSIKYSLDQAVDNRIINNDEYRWLIIGLCHAALKIASTTGHFAQFMKPSEKNIKTFVRQRKRSTWEVWLSCVAVLSPVGTRTWRENNKCFNKDSLTLLEEMSSLAEAPSVVYADPPYTDDQYSRYYHIWESLVLYDYPQSSGIGRYRPDRYTTPFSKKSTVIQAMDDFVLSCRKINVDLVLSYPENGLLSNAGSNIIDTLKKHYKNVEISHCVDYQHSTMGASKGEAKLSAKEFIYLART